MVVNVAVGFGQVYLMCQRHVFLSSGLPVIHSQSAAGSKGSFERPTSRLPGTNPANFREARFWTTVSGRHSTPLAVELLLTVFRSF
jgi:hypothetical protein